MNGAVVGSGGGQWLVRGAKSAVFDLPEDAEVELDFFDVERTSQRAIATDATVDRAAITSEVDANDILTEVPIDPTVPFQMKVPETVHARAARLTARLPQLAQPSVSQPVRSARALVAGNAPRSKRSLSTFAAVFVAFAVLGTGAGLVMYENAPIPSSNAHAFKAAAAAKVLAQRPSEVAGFMVPTVHVDSLPRVRR
jgi:hypothetical protein